jgi:hypothetical protein
MQEIFWFFLGGFVYLVLDKINSFFKKAKFVNDVKILAFKLIGVAYEQLIFAMTLKYISLAESNIDEEKIKLYKNTDEAAFLEWKRETVKGLKEALPPTYRGALEVEEWDDIMQVLDNHYKNTLRDARNSKETT